MTELNLMGNYLATKYGLTWTEVLEVPLRIAGLEAWYRADRGITLNGSDVSGWADQSGNGNDLVQAVEADQPLFNEGDANFNNKPTLSFSGVNDNLRSAAFAAALTQPNTIFTVYHMAGGGSRFVVDGLTASTQHVVGQNVGGDRVLQAGTEQAIGTESLDPQIVVALFNGASSNSWIDGVPQTPAGTVGADTMDGVNVGGEFNQNSSMWGEVAEIIVYDGALTDGEKNMVGQYLATKYGTTWTSI